MSGTALTMVSPSSVRIRRSVVCVAGCCGPKFSVQRYSRSTPGSAAASMASNGMNHQSFTAESAENFDPPFCLRSLQLTVRPRNRREIVPFSPAAQRVVLAQRECRELLRHQNPPQIGMAVENDAEHVVDLAF